MASPQPPAELIRRVGWNIHSRSPQEVYEQRGREQWEFTCSLLPDENQKVVEAFLETEPAARYSVITLYGTGEGLTDGPNISGKAAAAPYPRPKLPVRLTVAGIDAEILFAGSAPGLVGTIQINARLPGGFVPVGQVAVQLTVGTAAAPPLTILLK